MRRLALPSVAAAIALLIGLSVGCGGDSDDSGADAALGSPSAVPAPLPGWSLTSAQLCDLLSGAEVAAAVGEDVTAEAHAFDGCRYTGATLSARLTETVFTAAEYADYMPQAGASWVNETEAGETVLAYTGDGLVLDAWFIAAGEALVLSVTDGLGESVVLALISAARR